jgi:hypothetical protein
VIEAEAAEFTTDQAAALTPILRRFIDDHRESNDPADLVAVGSAIRKFVAIASPDLAFDYAANLLKVGGRAPLPIGLELELAKMVVRKLTARPPESDGQYPDLTERLYELVETYLNPRLLAREKHGAVALNGVLGSILVRDPRGAPYVCELVRIVGVSWFRQLVAQRADQLRAEIERRDSSDRFLPIAQALSKLIAAASA